MGYEGTDGLSRYRRDLASWLDREQDHLSRMLPGTDLAGNVQRMRGNQKAIYDEGWSRWGWPEHVGGLGGSSILRAALAEELVSRELIHEMSYALTEVLTPAVVEFGPDVAARWAPRWLSGQEGWCQGFSEPDSGSDLASLRCRAIEDGDRWVVTGQKIWTSFAQFADHIVLLVRTGASDSRHRGISALFVDMDWPGVTLNPLRGMNDVDEFSEVFFDEVSVPKDRMIGALNGGWALAMRILRSERGGIFWMDSAWLVDTLNELVAEDRLAAGAEEAIGHAYASLFGLRSRSWTTQHRMAAGTIPTQETSIDKILMAGTEQEIFDLAQWAGGGLIEFAEGAEAAGWRSKYMYSRAASIYGGTAEIQRNIVAEHLLGLGRGQ